MIETIVYDVIQIKPSTGIVSATREGVLWCMAQEGVFLPPDYLWQVEKVFGERTQSDLLGCYNLFCSK